MTFTADLRCPPVAHLTVADACTRSLHARATRR